MKKFLPLLGLVPALALVWQVYVYQNNQRREDRKERQAWKQYVEMRFNRVDSCFKALHDTVYFDKTYNRIVDEAVATAESRVAYLMRRAREDTLP